jgi:glyoxylase I family protein
MGKRKINYVQHIAINTKDIEASVGFYRDLMGFAETKRVDMGDSILVYMQVGDDCYLELFDQKGRTTDEPRPDTQAGLRHLAFDVDDLSEWNDFLKEKGVPFIVDLVEMPELGKRGILFTDPDGTVLELGDNL